MANLTKLLTNREMELLRLAINLNNNYLLSNGIKPSFQEALKLCGRLSFKVDEDDIAECLENIGI